MSAPGQRSAIAGAWLMTALVATWLAGSVYRMPVQVSDGLEVIQNMTPASVGDAVRAGLTGSSTMLRPLRQVQTLMLVRAAEASGGRFHLVFRGYHALAAVVLVVLFFIAARPATWNQTIAFTIALTVLIGMRGFVGMMREAYPVNHFLLIAVYALAAHLAGRTRGGWWADAIAIGCLILGLLTLESGPLVWVAAVVGYLAGLRGISRGALIVMTVVLVAYVALRVGYLQISPAGLGSRATGFGVKVLSPDEQIERFGDRKWPLYLYTGTMSMVTVALSQPERGQWTAVSAIREGSLPPRYIIDIVTSALTTLLILWHARQRPGDPVILVSVAVLLATAAVSYAYAKDEISSVTGVFYALAVYGAVSHALNRVDAAARSWRSALLAVVMLLVATGWAFRAAGVQYKMERTAFNVGTEWANVLRPRHERDWPSNPRVLAVTRRMKDEALEARVTPPVFLPRWGEAWWGAP